MYDPVYDLFDEDLQEVYDQEIQQSILRSIQMGSSKSVPKVQPADRLLPHQMTNRPVQAINRPAQTINRPAQTINRPAQTINRPAQTINRPAQTINRPTAPHFDFLPIPPYTPKPPVAYDRQLYDFLRQMFPTVSQNQLLNLVTSPPFTTQLYDEVELREKYVNYIIDTLLPAAAPKVTETREQSVEAVYEQLQSIFPNASKSFLYRFAQKNYKNAETIDKFVEENTKEPKYPTDEKCVEREELRKTFVKEFAVERFVEIFGGDPFEYFEDPKRKAKYNYDALQYLKRVYNTYKINELFTIYEKNVFNLTRTIKELDEKSTQKGAERAYLDVLLNTNDTDLILEVVFLKNKFRIQKYMQVLDRKEYREIRQCIKKKSFVDCECCLIEYIPSRLIACSGGHKFCKACIKRSIEVRLSEAKYTFDCIINCGAQFNINQVQSVVLPSIFRKFFTKWQEVEIQKAKIDGLVSCPFCHFASIPPKQSNIFECLNQECKKISCRLCKKVDHSPYRCDVKEKARQELEEELTKALVRRCYKCQKPYIKVEGCNFITCECGAMMCYVCGQQISAYGHFGRCKQMTNNIEENEERVMKLGQQKAQEILQKHPELKKDADKLLTDVRRY